MCELVGSSQSLDNKPPPRAWQWSTLSHSVCFLDLKIVFFRRHFFSHRFILNQTMVFDRIQPLHSVASPQAHDVFSQEANTLSYVHLLNLMGVTSLERHTRPTCHQALFEMFIKKRLMLTSIQCVFHGLLVMRGVWGFFSWFAHAQ